MAENAPQSIPGVVSSAPPPTEGQANDYANTWAARLAQAEADANDFFAEGQALLDDIGNQPTPAKTEGTTAPTTSETATAATQTAHGPEGTPSQQHVAKTSPSPDTSGTPLPPDQTADPEAANSKRRADSHQAILQNQVAELNARLAALQEENQKLYVDNRVLFGQHEQVRELARRQGVVRYEDVDQAITDSAVRENQRQQAEQVHLAQQEAARQQQNAGWQTAVGERVVAAQGAREQTISRILEAAIETQQPLSYDQAAAMVKAGYEDPQVLADIQLWRSDRVPTDIANQRISLAFARIAEGAKQKLVQQAVQGLKDEGGYVPGAYNREMPLGTGQANVAANRSSMTYQQRVQADLEAWQNQSDSDMRRLTG